MGDVSAEIGQKLLQGWTMLAECCPNESCNVPLVERKRDQTIYCCKCIQYFKRYVNKESNEVDIVPIDASDEETPKQFGNSRMNQISIDEIKNDNASQSPNQDIETDDMEVSEVRQKYQGQVRSTFTKLTEVTTKMGEKLLEGWTLLQQSCPGCSVPLMKDKNGTMYCLSCNTMVITPGQYDPTKHNLLKRSEHSQPRKESSDETNVHTGEEKRQPQYSYPTKMTSVTEQQQAPPPIPPRPSPLSSTVLLRESEHQMLIENTVQALYRKIDDCQRVLVTSSETHRCQSLCSLITECATAIKALNDLGSSTNQIHCFQH